jgi:tetratricopeptide (TPR) repeat protein
MASFVFVLAISACTSAEELMDDGIELEAKGSYEEAASKYLRALRKDDGLTEARERLQWVADTLVVMYLDRSAQAEDFGRPIEAAEPFLDIDRLISGASEVDVDVWLPEDYYMQRRSLLDAAIADLRDRARGARSAGRFGEASDLLSDAVERFDPAPPTRDQLLIERFDILLAWTDDASARGRFREAVRHTDEALAIAETVALDPTPAVQRRNAAMEAGTVYVAATPVWRGGRHERDWSRAFLLDLNDRLELDYWSNPPDFIVFAHPALVRRRLRQLDLEHESLSNHEAGIIARDLDADFAVVAEIDRFDVVEKDVHRKEKQAKTRGGNDAFYVEIQGEVEVRARLTYAIVDRNGGVVRSDDFEEQRSSDFTRAEYKGNYRDLDISRGTRDLFDRDRYDESLEKLQEELAERLAQRLGQAVFDRILSRIG